MRVLVVTDSLVWTAETEYAAAVARAAARAGGSVSFASPGARFADALAGVRVLDLPGTVPSRSPADFAFGARWLSELARRERFDVVHTSRPTAHVMAAFSTGWNTPLVHLRGSASPPRAHAVNRFLYRRLTTGVVASSERVRRAVIERLGVSPERVHRLLAPVDTSVFHPSPPDPALRRALGIPDGAMVIVNVARLAPVKGHDVLVRAMASVAPRCPGAVLVLVGEPWSGQPGALIGEARRLGIEASVVVTGRRDDVPSLLALADVCVSSSVGSEENSRAVSEYMAAGRPVVATSVGVVPELVRDGGSGLLVPPRDAAALGSALSSLLTDPARARRMGEEGRKLAVAHLSCEAFSRAIAEILEGAGVVS